MIAAKIWIIIQAGFAIFDLFVVNKAEADLGLEAACTPRLIIDTDLQLINLALIVKLLHNTMFAAFRTKTEHASNLSAVDIDLISIRMHELKIHHAHLARLKSRVVHEVSRLDEAHLVRVNRTLYCLL